MQMYDIVATGVLGLVVGFWSGRSIRWKMEETEETGEDREERKNTAARQLVREGVTIGSPVNKRKYIYCIRRNEKSIRSRRCRSGNCTGRQ